MGIHCERQRPPVGLQDGRYLQYSTTTVVDSSKQNGVGPQKLTGPTTVSSLPGSRYGHESMLRSLVTAAITLFKPLRRQRQR